jgi:DNA-binding CsgD family transcriptional regulator
MRRDEPSIPGSPPDAEARLAPWTRVLLDCLTPRGREAITLRELGLTYAEIGARMEISTSRARQLCEAAARRMTGAAARAVTYAKRAGVVASHACLPVHAPGDGPGGCVSGRCLVPAAMASVLDIELTTLPLGVRALNCLDAVGIRHVGSLITRTEGDLLRFMNLGRITLREIRGALGELDLHLGMDVGAWSPPCDGRATAPQDTSSTHEPDEARRVEPDGQA